VDLALKGRGIRITDHVRHAAEQKLGKIGRVDPRVSRLDVEVIGDLNPRMGATHRVEVACRRGRRTFRAEGTGDDVDSALDDVVGRLERQLATHRGKLRSRLRLLGRADRLQSRRTRQE
jgi:ribosomal subunit interface protein